MSTNLDVKNGFVSDERPEVDMVAFLKKRQADGKPLIIIDPVGDHDLLEKTDEIINVISNCNSNHLIKTNS